MNGTKKDDVHIRVFQHTASEPLGYFEEIFSEGEIPYEYVRVWEDEPVNARSATHLIFLGGPMSVNDEDTCPWLRKEKELIRWAVKKRVPVLGLCLGAQLIASAHGATVYKYIKETGWHPVHPETGSTGVFAMFPGTFSVFQMHGETFYLPVNAKLQCRGSRVPHQAFRLGSALGLQFHLEMTESLILDWTRGERKIRKEKILRDTRVNLGISNFLCRAVATEFIFDTVGTSHNIFKLISN